MHGRTHAPGAGVQQGAAFAAAGGARALGIAVMGIRSTRAQCWHCKASVAARVGAAQALQPGATAARYRPGIRLYIAETAGINAAPAGRRRLSGSGPGPPRPRRAHAGFNLLWDARARRAQAARTHAHHDSARPRCSEVPELCRPDPRFWGPAWPSGVAVEVLRGPRLSFPSVGAELAEVTVSARLSVTAFSMTMEQSNAGVHSWGGESASAGWTFSRCFHHHHHHEVRGAFP